MELKAFIFATEKHKAQFRRSGEPYIYHCRRVAETVKQYTQNEAVIAAALLHDTLEDTETIKRRIRKGIWQRSSFHGFLINQ